ncbi:bifunctional phosphopantothenoylcysteine decarboxylase/phosphopantothenate--cysteine ligase CoaBC [Methanolapillus millepedarum]|uniref:Coenzyme A biosynthesis bifunctional protein CoaBC n=1 Tax=Methanolapillus millepedarum TaxID=3028296 RepID=A0AA97A3P0_9EURY|nr:Coenzyme A biosynthesis bifunctional protein CoaBC [Methanosarcinaceae archaeon Ac7]
MNHFNKNQDQSPDLKASSNSNSNSNPNFTNPDSKANQHPTRWISESKGNSLSGKTIVIGVTGSIAAVSIVTLARELIRYGADVFSVTTDAACQIIHPNALHYATGNPVITELSGRVEHVEFFGSKGRGDLLLIAPATANTISKIAMGIDDTPVTTFATTAIGEGKKVMIVPAMHESMYRHPKVIENLKTLKSWGIEIVGPRMEEGIAKIANNDEIVWRIKRALEENSPSTTGFSGTNIFITSGATAESIDSIRILTNRASGKTGTALALSAYEKGAEVFLFHRNKLDFDLPHLNEIYVESADDMTKSVIQKIKDEKSTGAKHKNILISAAAISDYTTDKKEEKIKSGKSELILSLHPTKKLIEEAKKADPDLLVVAFKAETAMSFEELMDSAAQKINEGIADIVVANNVREKGMGTDDNDVYLVFKDLMIKWIPISGRKEMIADEILKFIAQNNESKGTTESDNFTNKFTAASSMNSMMLGDKLSEKANEIGDADDENKLMKDQKESHQKSGRYKKPVQMKGRVFKR